MTPPARARPAGRHRAGPRPPVGGTGRPSRPAVPPVPPLPALLVGLAVLLVVTLGVLVASGIGGDPAGLEAREAGSADGTGGASAPAGGPGQAGTPTPVTPGPGAGSGSGSGSGSAMSSSDAARSPLPSGDPIPGPPAPLPAADDVAATALRVPAIGVDVPLARLGIQPDGSIEVPADPDEAGWLTASAVPGRTGPAVLAGHVDSATGVAVFTRLGELVPGDEVEVGLSDGSVARYVVTGSERYPKDAFPSAAVYGPVPVPALRLITCGGRFDRTEGSYEDNLVVYAVPAT